MTSIFRDRRPIVYAMTGGKATPESFDLAAERILFQVEAAVEARVQIIQIREKLLTSKQIYEITQRSAAVTRGTGTKLLVNERADIAQAAGADGVHLTSTSIPVPTVRKSFEELIVGVSVHDLEGTLAAKNGDAHFIVFGPVFETPEKPHAIGLRKLSECCSIAAPMPVIGLGGINASNAEAVMESGASGVAGIRSFYSTDDLRAIVEAING